jgi:hypothetical protein
MDDTGEGGRWMSYAEFAEARGISKASAIRMIQRRGWQRRPGNDGTARILVPPDALAPPGRQPPRSAGEDTAPGSDLLQQALAALEAALAEANSRAGAALALADRLGAQLADTGDRADRLERDLAAAHVIARAAQRDAQEAQVAADQARAQAKTAQDRADELRKEEEARKARGRLRRAWEGWRGR